MDQTSSVTLPWRRAAWRWPAIVTLAAALLVMGVLVWAAPREQVPVPGPGATPEQVVSAYLRALNARDFDTANAIDTTGPHLGRFSRALRARDIEVGPTTRDGRQAQVLFSADFSGSDGTLEDGQWGYVLERARDGRWHITDQGVY